MLELTIALMEEIGDPNFFVGREEELTYFLRWAHLVKPLRSQSTAILARRKKGKTALVQRLYNLLYTQNDPQVIPFYFRVPEQTMGLFKFSELFYRSLLSQYFAFQRRDPSLIQRELSLNKLEEYAEGDSILLEDIQHMQELKRDQDQQEAWEFARQAGHRISSLKDQRIIQIIDEFQFLNQYIYTKDDLQTHIKIASSYQGTAESKVSPQIITGSYVGWLTKIIRKMVSRYDEYYLESLSSEEAIEAVYNYSRICQVPVKKEVSPYLAQACYNDPYYLAQVIQSRHSQKDLTTAEGVRETLQYETTLGKGRIAKVWMEYIDDAFEEINDRHAKKMVLYLAKYDGQERDRDQIRDHLENEISDSDLEDRLKKLIKADILAPGSSNFHYQGLGDPIFAMIFRRLYEIEIYNSDLQKVETEIETQLKKIPQKSSHQQSAYLKGLLGEYRLMKQIEDRFQEGKTLADLVYNPQKGLTLGPIHNLRKDRIYVNHEKSVEADIFIQGEGKGNNFIIEVKDWNRKLPQKQVLEFIEKVELLRKSLKQKTGYILYCKKGFPEKSKKLLEEHSIMYSDEDKLA